MIPLRRWPKKEVRQLEKREKKKKVAVKVRDIAPKKDAKGGRLGDPCEGGEFRRR